MWSRGVGAVVAEVASRQISAREVVAAALDRVEALDGDLRAFTVIDREGAMQAAREIDDALASGAAPRPLEGIPLAVKDLHHAAGLPTSWGSAALASGLPAAEDSPIVARLRRAGCVVVGKTNTSELGWKPLTDNPTFGATRHPLDGARSPGGSSGGSAVAVVSGMVPLATGSDGGGSIRIPAAVCGLPGFKASPGHLVEDPDALWPTLSVDGVLTATVADLTLVLPAIEAWGHAAALPPPALPSRVLWSASLGYAEVDPDVAAVCAGFVAQLEGAGVGVSTSEDLLETDPLPAWLAITSADNRARVEHLRGTGAWDLLDEGLRRQVERASRDGAGDALARADEVRGDVRCRLDAALRDVDLILTPTIATTAPSLEGMGDLAGRSTSGWVRFTYPCNLAGLPAATLPVGRTSSGWPVGLQLIGRRGTDRVLLAHLTAFAAVVGM